MRSKRALLLIVVGTLCAAVAAWAVQKRISAAGSRAAPIDGAQILLAARDIEFGEALRLPGEHDDPNVMLVSGWPKNLLPAGAIGRKEDIMERQMIAGASFVKHQPILQPQIVAEEEFVPQGMYLQKVVLDPDHIRRFRPGMTVDVSLWDGEGFVDFMRCVRIQAIGKLDRHGRPVQEEEPEPNVHFLVKEEHETAFMKIEGQQFHLSKAADADCEGPILVSAEAMRMTEARWLLDRAYTLMAEGEHERALALLREITAGYPDLAEIGSDAGQEAEQCREIIADKLLLDARAAFEEDGDRELALKLLSRIEMQPDYEDDEEVMQRVAQLRMAVQRDIGQAEYDELLRDIKEALAKGHLPAVEGLLTNLEQLSERGFEPGSGQPVPAEALRSYRAQLRASQSDFELDTKVLQAHLEQGKYAEARAKLQEIKQEFPAHPGIEQLEKLVPAAEGGGG